MSDRLFLDTNVVVYLFDRDAPQKRRTSRQIVERYGREGRLVVSTQVLQEFYVTVTRKLAKPVAEEEAEAATRELAALHVVEVDTALVLRGVSRARGDRLSLWDALVIESALVGRCGKLLTEDLQDGRRFGDLLVENPFR